MIVSQQQTSGTGRYQPNVRPADPAARDKDLRSNVETDD